MAVHGPSNRQDLLSSRCFAWLLGAFGIWIPSIADTFAGGATGGTGSLSKHVLVPEIQASRRNSTAEG
eukprot:symbB.v1.2.037243.t1/scaffold5443.1/size27125/5